MYKFINKVDEPGTARSVSQVPPSAWITLASACLCVSDFSVISPSPSGNRHSMAYGGRATAGRTSSESETEETALLARVRQPWADDAVLGAETALDRYPSAVTP